VYVKYPVSKYNLTTEYKGSDLNFKKDFEFVKPEHRLLKIFNSISGGSKIKLDGHCSQYIYNKNTINSELKNKLIHVIKDIIDSINSISECDYYIKTIENVYVSIDRKQNQRYIVDFFIYDTKNYYTIRLIGDIAIIDDDIYINYLHIQSGSNALLINKYDFKLNSLGILFDSNMFTNGIINIFDNYYTSKFNVIGIEDKNLEYNSEDLSSVYSLNSLRNMYLPSSVSEKTYEQLNKKGLSSYLEMYLPENQNLIKSKLFCDKYSLNWNNYGLPNEGDKSDENCYINNYPTTSQLNQPWFGPGVIHKRVSENKYDWINDYSRKNIYKKQ
jgi:hypothetical protein